MILLTGCGSPNPAANSQLVAKPANAMVGIWKLVLSEDTVKMAPPGTKLPEITMTFNEDGTYEGRAKFDGKDSTLSGTYTLKDRALHMVTKLENGKPATSPDFDIMLDSDLKAFSSPGGDGTGKMVKQ